MVTILPFLVANTKSSTHFSRLSPGKGTGCGNEGNCHHCRASVPMFGVSMDYDIFHGTNRFEWRDIQSIDEDTISDDT